jgi:hypothetical protein
MAESKPPLLRSATLIWAVLVVGFLVATAVGVVTLFGSKFGPALTHFPTERGDGGY